MVSTRTVMDGNEAAAHVAFRTNEVIAIYPITPASPMGELSDAWSAAGKKNLWGSVPRVIEMQSEGGAAGAVHGALQAGALTTTFTASQGLLLMIPNMYKIAGELTPTVFHIAARSVAAQALSIFGDHSDVMAARGTGWAMLFGASVQEAMDMAMVAHAATFRTRLPFLNIFDGFRTSHELQRIEVLSDDVIRAMMDEEAVRAHRQRAMSPDRPTMRGTAQNPDVFFQARESVNPVYRDAPAIVQETMDRLAGHTGRQYRLVDYVGHPKAERVIVQMGSGIGASQEAVHALLQSGERVGLLKIRLFRPFPTEAFLEALPETVRGVAVLDRTKEPGSAGEPLYQDVLTALHEGGRGALRVIGGRYGLSSKEYTPAMAKGVLDHLATEAPRNHFTVGIVDDVTGSSIDYDAEFSTESPAVTRAVFWGLGSDGTVGANKNSIKIIGNAGDGYAQGYFVYDSKKSGARTVSHLRFGPQPIESTYLISSANFVAVHQWGFMDRYDCLEMAAKNATVLINSPFGKEEVFAQLPGRAQKQIIQRGLKLYVIDAYRVARDLDLGPRINTIMQTCFFRLSDVLDPDEATRQIKAYIQKTYGKRGQTVVDQNFAAVDAALAHLEEVPIPGTHGDSTALEPIPASAPDFVRAVTGPIMAGRGDLLPVSALPMDGVYPTGTTKWEKRQISQQVPIWNADLCIQCGKCVMVCPHAVIRSKVASKEDLASAPTDFQHLSASWRDMPDARYTIQVSVDDCTGCNLCVEVCPARDKSKVSRKALEMADVADVAEAGRVRWDFFTELPDELPGNGSAPELAYTKVKDLQLLQPYFEFSGACAGCGETPYLSLLTRLVGDRLYVANATGCSSIYGGNLPTTPWSTNKEGRGPTWANSLFEDNAEFGFGMRVAVDKQREYARELLGQLAPEIGADFAAELLKGGDTDLQRQRVDGLKKLLGKADTQSTRDLLALADLLVEKSVWIVGGDGWAYDIGFGGLDHVLASGQNINILVLDTEVYSNTGGQASKATGLGAVAKFAAGGKATPKKDLGLLAMSYGYVYVAQVAMGSDENHTIKAFREAEAYDGPSLIIAYSQCIAHGIDMEKGMEQQALAVKSGHWPLFRFDPRRKDEGLPPFQLDSRAPSIPLKDYVYRENRYRVLRHAHPEAADAFLKEAQKNVQSRWNELEMKARPSGGDGSAQGSTGGPTLPPGSARPAPTMPPGSARPAPTLPPGSARPGPTLPPGSARPGPTLPPGTSKLPPSGPASRPPSGAASKSTDDPTSKPR